MDSGTCCRRTSMQCSAGACSSRSRGISCRPRCGPSTSSSGGPPATTSWRPRSQGRGSRCPTRARSSSGPCDAEAD
eukprot:1475378-Alexandrium_andersonii.AAC.1